MLTDDDHSHDDNCRFESIASDIDISGPSIPKAGEARHILKRLQPYCEKPSKDRHKHFCAGKIYGDEGISADHDVSIHQFWALNPQNAKISRAKCFLVGQIVSMFHLGVLCNSEKKCNKNLQIAMDLFTYLPESSKYIRNGRSGLLKANSLLLVNITENIKIIGDDVDIESRLATTSEELDVNASNNDEDDGDPFIVENVLDKRFHRQRNQYEYLVSWVGYTDQTWELPSNIPPRLLEAYENRTSASREPNSTQYSLRPVRKLRKMIT